MIFLRLKVDNLYMFRNAEVDFSYPRRLRHSLIEGEYLEDYPQIRFKRACIIMGPNASGKTTLGRLMCAVNNYLSGAPLTSITQAIYDQRRPATIEVLYVVPALECLRRLRLELDTVGLRQETLWEVPLRKHKSLKALEADLDSRPPRFHWTRTETTETDVPLIFSQARLEGWELDKATGWHYIFSEMDVSSENLAHEQQDLTLLGRVLRAFDPAIQKVLPSQDKSDAYVIVFDNGDRIIVEEGQLRQNDRLRLSRGTLEAIEVAKLMASIIHRSQDAPDNSHTFFLDEKMAYSHTEMEKAILNVMIERLGRHSQLFYTTHNHDMLTLALPSHSYLFMRKDHFVEFVQPEKMGFAKNDRNLLGYVRNDVFGTIPDTSHIDALLEDA